MRRPSFHAPRLFPIRRTTPTSCGLTRTCARGKRRGNYRFASSRSGSGNAVGFDPGSRQLEILISAVLPREMAGLDEVELAVGQPRVQELGVARRHERVVATGDDLNRSPDVAESLGEEREVR